MPDQDADIDRIETGLPLLAGIAFEEARRNTHGVSNEYSEVASAKTEIRFCDFSCLSSHCEGWATSATTEVGRLILGIQQDSTGSPGRRALAQPDVAMIPEAF